MLSTKSDVKLDIHMMQKIKNRSWLLQTGLMAGKGEASMGKDAGMSSEVMMKKEKRLKRLRMKEESEKGEGTMSAYRKRMKRRMELEAKGLKKFRKSGSFARRKSLTVLHDDGTVAMRDLG